jgi:transposase
MKSFSELTHFGALDWASQEHHAVILDSQGRTVESFRFEESAEGWASFRQRLRPFPALGFAVETNCGWVIERLLEAGLTVFPVPPKQAKAFRERFSSSGAKDDPRDALALADALRVDGQRWRPLRPEDELTQKLRLLTRDEVALIEERTAKVLQLKAALHEYYPAALEAFEDWVCESSWNFVLTFPTPQLLQAAGRRRHEKFLHANDLARSPERYEARLKIFARAAEFCGSPAVTEAKSLLAISFAKLLRQIETQLKEYRKRIQALFNQHPDHFIFSSLPHAAAKLRPRLLSELGTQRDVFPDSSSVQCYAGTAPVTERSGKSSWIHFRRACNKHFRHAVHLWASEWLVEPSWGKIYYQHHRDQGCSHADALRRLGNRLLKILWRIWYNRVPYNESIHQQNQLQHGSWVLQLSPATPIPYPKTEV